MAGVTRRVGCRGEILVLKTNSFIFSRLGVFLHWPCTFPCTIRDPTVPDYPNPSRTDPAARADVSGASAGLPVTQMPRRSRVVVDPEDARRLPGSCRGHGESLENPRLRIVSDMVRLRTRTNGTNGRRPGRTSSSSMTWPTQWCGHRLKWAFSVPGRLRQEEPVGCSPSAWQPRSRRPGAK